MTSAAQVRAGARQQVRDLALDAAHRLAVSEGWSAVRMGAVAGEVGVSRQTLHAEFGTKDALGQAMVLRVTDRFLLGVTAALEQHPGDLSGGLRAAVRTTLQQVEVDSLLQTVLSGGHPGVDDALLPLLTSRGQPLLDRAREALESWVVLHHPELAHARVHDVTDSVVRLVLSHAVLPVDPPEVVAARVAELAELGLRGG